MSPHPYTVGPFTVDETAGTVTLAPGTYTLTEPLTFRLPPIGELTGVTYVGPVEAPDAVTPPAEPPR